MSKKNEVIVFENNLFSVSVNSSMSVDVENSNIFFKDGVLFLGELSFLEFLSGEKVRYFILTVNLKKEYFSIESSFNIKKNICILENFYLSIPKNGLLDVFLNINIDGRVKYESESVTLFVNSFFFFKYHNGVEINLVDIDQFNYYLNVGISNNNIKNIYIANDGLKTCRINQIKIKSTSVRTIGFLESFSIYTAFISFSHIDFNINISVNGENNYFNISSLLIVEIEKEKQTKTNKKSNFHFPDFPKNISIVEFCGATIGHLEIRPKSKLFVYYFNVEQFFIRNADLPVLLFSCSSKKLIIEHCNNVSVVDGVNVSKNNFFDEFDFEKIELEQRELSERRRFGYSYIELKDVMFFKISPSYLKSLFEYKEKKVFLSNIKFYFNELDNYLKTKSKSIRKMIDSWASNSV